MKLGQEKTDSRFYGQLAIGHLIAGLLGPFLVAKILSGDVALGFAVVALLLALLFGILGWKQKSGQVTSIVVSCLVIVAAINWIISVSQTNASQNLNQAEIRLTR
jgi:hypothetical protein